MKGMYYHPDKTKDFGFAGHMSGGFKYYKSKETGGAPDAIEQDHFFVTKLLDAELHGSNTKYSLLYEMQGLYRPWSFDVGKLQCPCFLYHGQKEEVPLSNAKRNHELINGSELIVMHEHGHCSIMMEFENIVAGLVDGRGVQGSYH